MKPRISVVIPVYNCEKYVARAVKSVINQPCANMTEVLVIDDGSKDKTGQICSLYRQENVKPVGWKCAAIALPVRLGLSIIIDLLICCKTR